MMLDMTVNRNISSIVPLPFFGGIRPLCVPMQHDSSFSNEVGSRFSTNVDSLWERLGLVFLIEEQQTEAPSRNEVVINNFSSKLIMQLFGNKNIRRLMELHQSGNVYSDIIIKQAERRLEQTEQRISAEITERILQTERITAQLNAVSAMLSQKDDESCTVQMMCSLLTNVMNRHIGTEELTFSETQIIDRLEQRLRSSENIQEKQLHNVIEELRTAEVAPNESRARILSAVAEHIGTASCGSDVAIAAELATEAVEKGGMSDAAERITQTVRELDTHLTEKRYFGGVESELRGDSKHPNDRAVGRVKSIDEPQDIRRSVTELLFRVTDGAEGQSVTHRIENSFTGKGIEEINRVIRSVNEQRGITNHASVITDIAGNVICHIMERQKAMQSSGDNSRERAGFGMPFGSGRLENASADRENPLVSLGERRVLLGDHNSYTLNYSGNVYLTNSTEGGVSATESAETSGTPAEGRVLLNEQNSYNINRAGDVYFTNSAESGVSAADGAETHGTPAEGRIVPNGQNSYNINHAGDVYFTNTAESGVSATDGAETSGTSAEGRIVPNEQNSYNINRMGDVYLTNVAENSYISGLERSTAGFTAKDYKPVSARNYGMSVADSRIMSLLSGAETLSLITENADNPVYYSSIKSAVNRLMNIDRRIFHSGDEYVNSTILSGRNIVYLPKENIGQVGSIMQRLTDRIDSEQYVPSKVKDLYSEKSPTTSQKNGDVYNSDLAVDNRFVAEGRILPTEQNSYKLNRAGGVYISNTPENAASAPKSGNVSSSAAEGRILPTEQNSYTLNRAGDVYISNAPENAASAPKSGNAPHTAPAAEGRILPTDQNSYTLNRAGDVYISNTAENAASAPKSGNVSAPVAEGRILPTEQNNYTLNRAGDVYISNAPENEASAPKSGNVSSPVAEGRILQTEQNNYTLNSAGDVYISNTTENAASAPKSGNVSSPAAEGRIFPTEQNNYTLNRVGDVYFNNTDMLPKNTETNLAGSYRSRLDSKTLAALDEMISVAGRQTSPRASEPTKESNAAERVPERAEMVYAKQGEQQDLQPMRTLAGSTVLDRAQFNQLRIAGVMRRGMGISPINNGSHITNMIHRLNESSADSGKPKQAFSYRTVHSEDDMVMLVPPVEMDRYQAENGYQRQMPPIELKQPQKPEQTEAVGSVAKRVVNAKNDDISVKTIGSIEGLSREDINKLVDKVYNQLETRLLRERRRRGL